jgi:hypothetical protein
MRAGGGISFLAAIELLKPKMRAEVDALGVLVAAALRYTGKRVANGCPPA